MRSTTRLGSCRSSAGVVEIQSLPGGMEFLSDVGAEVDDCLGRKERVGWPLHGQQLPGPWAQAQGAGAGV
jgi:hypothetical protein